MSEPTVVDLSHYQADVDFVAMAADGVLAVILKATEGWSVVDASFAQHYQQASKAGLSVASYHYLHHGNAQQQMQFYIDTLNPSGGERVCIDYEDAACTLDDLHEAVQWLLDYNDQTGMNLQIAVYSGHLLRQQLGTSYDGLLAENTSLWLAQYTSGQPSWPTGTYPVYSLWQYTDQARVGGYNGPVDGNRFNGSDEQLLAWIGPVSSAPIPVEPQVEVRVTLSATSPVTVNVVVEGNENVTIA